MADVSVKMGVSGISQFKQGMADAQASVKTLDAALKANEKQFQKAGDAENHMAAQTTLLNAKLQAQQNIVKNAEQALKQMEANGVRTSSKAYQDMQRKLIEAQSAMLDTQNEMEDLGTKAEDASGKTDKLAQSLGGINKKISLDQVIGAVNSITTGLENAAKKAIDLGEKLWSTIMDSARWADDTATMAQMYGIDIDTFLRMQKLVTNGLDTTVDAILTSQSKLNKGIGSESKATLQALDELHVRITQLKGDEGEGEFISRDQAEVFWEAGRAIMAMTEATEQEAAAQALFGRSWKELIPLFTEFKSLKEYNEALEGVNVVSEDTVEDLATMNDKVNELLGNFDTLKTEIVGALAPALTGAADALNGLLTKVLDYLETPEGKQALEDMGKAVEGLFSDLSSIDPEQVVEGFTAVFDKVVGGLQWLSEHSGAVITAMKAIVIGWGGLKLTGGVLQIVKLIEGITGLGAASGAAEAGAATGAAWGGGFAKAVLAAAPWLIGLYTLLNPGSTADNDQDLLWDPKTGEPTTAGKEAGITQNYEDMMREWEEQKKKKQTYSAEGSYNEQEVWENQLEYGNAWVAVTDKQREAMQKFWDVIREKGDEFTDADWQEYENAFEGQEKLFEKVDELLNHFQQTHEGELPEDLPENFFQIVAEPVLPDDAQTQLQNQLNTVSLVVKTKPVINAEEVANYFRPKANGIWSVPFDGYPAVLHKGERVVPAREVSNSRNFSSNLYVESMYMNNGTDAEGLAAAIAARNRRVMKGYGSC